MDLFIDSTIVFEKIGSEVQLPEDPNAWPNEILQELFKQIPYIADFEPHVSMERVDAERGFAFGHVEVMNKTEIQRGAPQEGLDAAGIRQARIPIIIKDRKLQPFDVVITEDSQMLPLTEPRLRQAIFRPQAFDITARTPGDMSMIGQLYPPYRQNYGFGGGGASQSVGMGKMSSELTWVDVAPYLSSEFIEKVTKHTMIKTGSVLTAILPTINVGDFNALFDKLENRGVQAALMKNASATAGSLSKLASYTPMSTEKTASALFNSIKPTVVQIVKSDDGYTVKHASHHCWMPKESSWDRGQIVRAYGEKIALDADTTGSVTMAPNEAPMPPTVEPEADKYEMIKDFGIYKVKTQEGKELIGYVFPNLIDTDGTPLPLFLFSNGSEVATQGEICGIRVGEGASIFEGHPRGRGAFYEMLTNGKAQATVPMTINATLQMPEVGEGTALHATTFDGRPVEVKVQPNITKIVPQEGTMLVPETMRWLALDNAADVVLIGSPDEAQAMNESETKAAFINVEIRSGGPDSFSIDGRPVEKIAKASREFLSFDDAIFLLSGLGVNLEHATEKLSQAMVISAPVSVRVHQSLSMPSELVHEAEKVASLRIGRFMSFERESLVKEASVIPDPTAVDTVLSLGFINPENCNTFISYLPVLDEGQKKMCELLVASRLGLRDVPTSALEKAIRSTEEVIEGLKILAFQKN